MTASVSIDADLTFQAILTLENDRDSYEGWVKLVRQGARLDAGHFRRHFVANGRRIVGHQELWDECFGGGAPEVIGSVCWESVAEHYQDKEADLRRIWAEDQRQADRGVQAVFFRLAAELAYDGERVWLPRKTSREEFAAVKWGLERLGARWVAGKRAAHVFAGRCAREVVEEAIASGRVDKPFDHSFVPTPVKLAADVARLAQLEPGMRVLEPGMGSGRLADAALAAQPAARVEGFEIDEARAQALAARGLSCRCGDFLAQQPEAVYDRVLINPPFEGDQAVEHVRHGMRFLAPKGRLVAILPASVTFVGKGAKRAFRDQMAALGGVFHTNPNDAFAASGTHVKTVTLVLQLAEDASGRQAVESPKPSAAVADTATRRTPPAERQALQLSLEV